MNFQSTIYYVFACVCLITYYVHGAEQLIGKVGGKRTLVMVDNMDIQATHSKFFGDLEGRGHELSFILSSDTDAELLKYGDYLYDNIVSMAPMSDDLAFSTEQLIAFLDAGGNILMVSGAVDGDDGVVVGTTARQLGDSCGVDLDEDGTAVLDHFANANGDSASVKLSASRVLALERVVGAECVEAAAKNDGKAHLLFRGVGAAVAPDNILALKVVTGNPTTYSAIQDGSTEVYPQSAGSDSLLVVAVQARNNARITFSGSLDLFSDAYFTAKGALNQPFSAGLSAWTFGERGVLRATNVRHMRSDGTQPEVQLHERELGDLPPTLFPDPEIARSTLVYAVEEHVTYAVDIEEWDGSAWSPFKGEDVQLEFVMLNPYQRVALQAPGGSKTFQTTFQIPDVYGIFKFHVMYRRPGLTTLTLNTQVSVRPFRHNEYPRFLLAAYPYYTGAFAVMAGFLTFSLFFMFSKGV